MNFCDFPAQCLFLSAVIALRIHHSSSQSQITFSSSYTPLIPSSKNSLFSKLFSTELERIRNIETDNFFDRSIAMSHLINAFNPAFQVAFSSFFV
jgi:hypothetical protein